MMAVLIWGVAFVLNAVSLGFVWIAGDFGSVEFTARLANTIATMAMLRLELMERDSR